MAESGRILGEKNVKAFDDFILKRDKANDWFNFIKPSGNRLVRKLVCEACGFKRSALSQNPILKARFESLECDLTIRQILKASTNGGFDCSTQPQFISQIGDEIKKIHEDIDRINKRLLCFMEDLEKFE